MGVAGQVRGRPRDRRPERGPSRAYCRQRGLYAEQIRAWRAACEQANDRERASTQRLGQATKDEKKRIKTLERDLARKEKALAEAAALLVLRKHAAGIYREFCV